MLVVPARAVDGGPESLVCNPNAVSGIECPIQGLLSSQSAQSLFFRHFATFSLVPGPRNGGIWQSDFDKKQCYTPKRHFHKN